MTNNEAHEAVWSNSAIDGSFVELSATHRIATKALGKS